MSDNQTGTTGTSETRHGDSASLSVKRKAPNPLKWAFKKLVLFVVGYLFCVLLAHSGNDALMATGAILAPIPIFGIVVMVISLLFITLKRA